MPENDYMKHNHLDETYELEDNDNKALSQLRAYVPTNGADEFIGSMLVAGIGFEPTTFRF